MACFLVPAAEAVVVTVAAQAMRKKAEKAVSLSVGQAKKAPDKEKSGFFTPRKLMWLAYLLWGGAFLLAYEHVWHGEVVPWFPFLTAAADPAEASIMLHEMGTAGVAMAVLVTVVWAILVAVSSRIVRRPEVGAAVR